MKASTLIGRRITHAVDTTITGEVIDLLFDTGLEKVAFVLADVKMPIGTAPVLFSPAVLTPDADELKVTAHPDDIAARHDASMHRAEVPIDPADLPSTFIGPFGNTFSPSMIAALFNARTQAERPTPPTASDGIWLTELLGAALRAHVADVGHVRDVVLDDHLTAAVGVKVEMLENQMRLIPPANIQTERSAENILLLSLIQSGIV